MNALLAALLLGPATPPPPPVVVGSKAFTESVILGEVIRQLLEARGIRATHTESLGGTPAVFKGLASRTLSVYVEYTGTLTQELLAAHRPVNEKELREVLAKQGLVMSGHLGFVNNYELGVPRAVAERHGLKAIGDLADRPDLRFALSSEFMGRKDGWPLIAERYGLKQKPAGMNHETALAGLVRGQADVTDLYSTDSEIAQYDLVALNDDRGVLPLYHAVMLYPAGWREDVVGVLKSLEGKITTERMTRMNAAVRVNRLSETAVAAEFLNEAFGLELPTGESRWGRLLGGTVRATWQHLLLVTVSLALAVAVAVPLGVVAYARPGWGGLILGTVGVIQTVPSMALLVFMIPLLGLGLWPALAALLLYGLLPIVRNTYQGLKDIPLALKESAEVIGLPPRARLWRVELPLASRSILVGIKTAAVINVGTATIGAIIGAGGYGQPILTGIRLDDVPMILSGAVPAALMALAVQGLFALVEPLVVPKGLLVS
ncbi:MAG: glycine betaine ABC transporter substrate-binding protein [Gemmataceae bacterium]